MKSANPNIIVGIGLMALGVLLLLDRLGLGEGAAFFAALLFAAVGALFLTVFARHRENWWAAIPGSVFLGLAAVVTAARATGSSAAGAFLFLFMGAGFAAIYLRERTNWWALIPCGVMLTLAVVVSLSDALEGTAIAAVLFLGLAATFAVLARVPVRTSGRMERMKWPLIPAAVLAVLGVIFALQSMAQLIPLDVVMPAVLVLAGVALVVYAYFARQGRQHKAHTPGPSPG